MRLELSSFRPSGPVSTNASLMAQWRVGAIVEAIAVRDQSDGQLWLNIGATRVPARIASGNADGPANGERLQLRVLRDHPVLALETLESDTTEASAVTDALRRFLPRQSSPTPLLANLAWLAQHPEDTQQLPRSVTEAVQKLWSALTDATDMTTAEGLANAVKNSGAFLESTLTQQTQQNDPTVARQTLTQDVKALLIVLKQTLTRSGGYPQSGEPPQSGPLPTLRGAVMPLPSTPPTLAAIDSPARQMNELTAQVEGTLSRIQTTQLVNSEAANTAAVWLVEVPIRRDGRGESVRFRFERHSPQSAPEQSWTVEAALDLGGGSSLHARVSLYGKRVGVQLRAEPPNLVAALAEKTPLLTAMLTGAGLDVDRVQCMHGMPIGDGDAPATTLLDVRA